MKLALPEYPGRGVLVYRDNGSVLWWLYFLTGRSDASRDRQLRYSVDRLIVEPTAPAALDDLRHYACTRSSPLGVVVGNGDHVDVLASAQEVGKVVNDIDPEPDAPIHTPRIAAVMRTGAAATELLAVRRVDHEVDRKVSSVTLDPRQGVVLHTYSGTARDIEVDAVPRSFEADVDGARLAGSIWSGLERSLRVGLAYGRAGTAEPSAILS